MVGALLAGDSVLQLRAGAFLHQLLQPGLVVLGRGRAFGDKGQDEGAGGLDAAVQIQRGDQRSNASDTTLGRVRPPLSSSPWPNRR